MLILFLSEKPYSSSFYQIYSDPLLNQEDKTEAEIPLILGAEEKEEEGKEEEGGEPIIKQMETDRECCGTHVILFYFAETWKERIKALFFPRKKKSFFCLIFKCYFDILDLDLHRKQSAEKCTLRFKNDV